MMASSLTALLAGAAMVAGQQNLGGVQTMPSIGQLVRQRGLPVGVSQIIMPQSPQGFARAQTQGAQRQPPGESSNL